MFNNKNPIKYISIFPKLSIVNNSPMKFNVPGKLKLARTNKKNKIENEGR